MIISNIKKNYPGHSTVVLYSKEFIAEAPSCMTHVKVNCQICFKRGKLKNFDQLTESQLQQYHSARKSSTRRAKTTVTDYALCNEFTQFITLTFDQKRFDSMDYDTRKKQVSKWINNQRRLHSPLLTYILVAEKHKKGGIHFHMIVNNYMGTLTPAINPRTGKNLIKSGKQIYNLKGWRCGFSTLSNIDNKEATARYLQKYLTKDFIEAFNKKRFWTSRGLKKPSKEYNVDFEKIKDDYPPLFRDLYKTENYYLYTLMHGSERDSELMRIKRFTKKQIDAKVGAH